MSVKARAVADIQSLLFAWGLSFLGRLRSRYLVLGELDGQGEDLAHCAVPRVVRESELAGGVSG